MLGGRCICTSEVAGVFLAESRVYTKRELHAIHVGILGGGRRLGVGISYAPLFLSLRRRPRSQAWDGTSLSCACFGCFCSGWEGGCMAMRFASLRVGTVSAYCSEGQA